MIHSTLMQKFQKILGALLDCKINLIEPRLSVQPSFEKERGSQFFIPEMGGEEYSFRGEVKQGRVYVIYPFQVVKQNIEKFWKSYIKIGWFAGDVQFYDIYSVCDNFLGDETVI